jgi:hypothetical protein
LLRSRQALGRDALIHELEISRATLKRYLEVLRDRINVPVVYDRDSNTYAISQPVDKGLEMGIWLVDASILALYRPGGERPTSSTCQKVLECCWDNYIRSQIVEANPSSILIIGKGVSELLKNRLAGLQQERAIKVDWVRQPQGCRSKEAVEEMHRKVFDHCKDELSRPGKQGLTR